MQQPPPNLATTLQQHPSYPPPMPNSQFPPHHQIFHPQQLPPPPAARHPPIPANSRQPIIHFVPNGLHLPVQRNEQHQNGLVANDGQMISRQQCQSNLQHQQVRESAYLPPNMLYPVQNQFHHNGAQYIHHNGPIMECSENAVPHSSAATTAIPYAQFSGHHQNYLPLPVPAAVPPPNNANGAMMPPIPIPIPPTINMNMNSHISPAAMAAAHAHPPPPAHFPPANANPHIHPHQFPPPSVSGQHHNHLLANKRAPGPSPAIGPNNAIENSSNNIGIAGPVDCWSTAVTGWEQAAMIKSKIGLIIGRRYRILQSIASGSYGEIFAAEDLHSHGPAHQKVAVKFDGACRDNHLRYEYDVYKSVLYEDGNGKVDGFPQVYSWSHEYGHNIMVMELLGPPVASLFTFCRRNFARETIVSLGTQMIQRIRHMHQRGFIHRDIKPENFLMGLEERGRESTLYLIDFGLARRYRYREGENRTLTHIPYRRGRSFIGTAKYASLNSHKNIELSRRDDLESLSYVLIELVNGQLPWKNISKRNATTRHQASQRIKQLKESAIWEEICPCMSRFIRYCREIHFNDEPDYDKLLDLLQLVLIPPAEFSIIFPSAISTRNTGRVKKIFASSTATTVCCQTLETAEKMTQVNLEQQTANNEETESIQNGDEQNIDDGEETKQLANSIQSQLSLNTAENVSDFDEIGAATTTTSCSENELESAGVEKVTITTSGTGTADDEDSQPTPQQEQQQVSRKCRRHRDQNHQQQQKRVIKEQPHPQNPQQITTQRVKIHTQPRVVDTGLQTDLPQQPIIHLPLALRQQKGGPSAAEQRKMCWQKERETNVERRFQYENKFSWTLPLQTAEPITMGASTSQNHLIAGHILNQQAPKAAANLAILPPAASILPTHPPLATAVHYAGPITNGFIVQAPKRDQHHPTIQMGMPPLIPSTVMHPPPNINGKKMPGTTAQFHAVNLRNPPPPSQINGGSINSSYTTSASYSVQKPIHHLTSIPPPRPILPEALQQQRGEGGRTLQVAFVLPPPPTHPTMQFN